MIWRNTFFSGTIYLENIQQRLSTVLKNGLSHKAILVKKLNSPHQKGKEEERKKAQVRRRISPRVLID